MTATKNHTDGVDLHLKPFIEEGYVVDDARFSHLRAWNFMLIQLHDAKHSLEISKRSESYEEKGTIPEILIEQSLIRNSLINYAKCFSSSGKGRISLDKNKVYKDNPKLLAKHEEIMEIRNKFSAHNDNSGLDVAHILTKEYQDKVVYKHFYTFANPFGSDEDIEELYTHCEEFIVKAINKAWDSSQKSIGKPIIPDE